MPSPQSAPTEPTASHFISTPTTPPPPQHQDRRAYEDAKKKLERIERERARLASLDLAGSYESLISCPICLEVCSVGFGWGLVWS